jgi:hypothetical protein
MKVNRRSFFKTISIGSLGVYTALKSGGLFVADAMAKTLDAGIKKMKYVHELKAPLKGQQKKHQKQLHKVLKANPGLVADVDSALPVCKYCKFWEEPKDGYGWCRYVAKKNNKKGQKAYKEAWCQMYKTENKKIDKLKKHISA